jgi:Ferric reductase NAD binding domain/FAD-binding domain
MLQTPAPIRHRFYEVFLHLHQFLVAVLLWGLWTHMDGYNTRRKILIGVMCIWAAEVSYQKPNKNDLTRSQRLARIIRIVYRNVGRPVTKAEIEVMSGIAMRVKVRLARPWTFTPGQHAYLYVPSVGWWTAHPFSVVWTDEDVEDSGSEKDVLPQSMDDVTTRKRNIYFLIRRMKGFTNDLYIKAQKNGGKLSATALVEGPYNHQTLHSYGTVVLIAAGIGITHIVPHVHDLVRGHGTGAVAARRVLLVWSVRTLEELELIRDWMTVILALPRRREVLRIVIYAFQLDKSETADLPSSTIQVFPGIAKFGPIMDEEVKNSVGSIGVCVCGIGVVADEVRFACRKWMDRVSIDFIEESFSW